MSTAGTRKLWETRAAVRSEAQRAERFGDSRNAMVQNRRTLGLKRPLNIEHLKWRLPPQRRNDKLRGVPFYVMDKGKRVLKVTVDKGGKRRTLMTMARKVWESIHGEVPKGYMVIGTNGYINDTRPENLECVTRGEATRRMMKRRPVELRKAIRDKQKETMRIRRKVRAYIEHKPYPLAA